ncbi:MAG: sodium:calcium antiporter [Acidobacteriota bacterium]
MEEVVAQLMSRLSWPLLAIVIALCMGALVRGADWLVGEAVALSERSGIPKVVIGATVVSLGTTTPEAVVSVLAAIQGRSGLALGNAVGSIICDTGLILGVACLISPLPLQRRIVNRQGWIQFGAGFLLVAGCFCWSDIPSSFSQGGGLSQATGFLFLVLLALYLWLSVRWSRGEEAVIRPRGRLKPEGGFRFSSGLLFMKLLLAIILVVASSWVLIPAVGEAAARLHVPESIIAATLVAFGTSLPELVTAVAAASRGHGELAVGNVVGADILNVLFVAGASAAVTSGGLPAPYYFFTLYFPSMLAVLIVFRIGIWLSGSHLRRAFGAILFFTYLLVSVFSYVGR